jgi:hypothetical protein
MKLLSKSVLSAGVAGILAVATLVPVSAAPAFSNPALIKSATEGQVVGVRFRGGGAVAAGVLGGLALGAVASGAYGAPYYGPQYYGPPQAAYGYGYGYDAAPQYYSPSYNGGDRLHNDVGNW